MTNILTAIGIAAVAILLMMGWTGNPLLNSLLLIPGHFIFVLLRRFAIVARIEENYDRDGGLSIILGGLIWGILVSSAYAVYRLVV